MAGMKARAFRPGCGPSLAAMVTGRHRASLARLGQGPGSGRANATAGPGGLASGLWARPGQDWRGCGLAGRCGCMGARFGCITAAFWYPQRIIHERGPLAKVSGSFRFRLARWNPPKSGGWIRSRIGGGLEALLVCGWRRWKSCVRRQGDTGTTCSSQKGRVPFGGRQTLVLN